MYRIQLLRYCELLPFNFDIALSKSIMRLHDAQLYITCRFSQRWIVFSRLIHGNAGNFISFCFMLAKARSLNSTSFVFEMSVINVVFFLPVVPIIKTIKASNFANALFTASRATRPFLASQMRNLSNRINPAIISIHAGICVNETLKSKNNFATYV